MKRHSETTAESLERLANTIRERTKKARLDPSTVSLLEQEIALTLEQLERSKEVHQEQLTRIIRAETYVDTDLIKLDSYHLRLFVHRHKVRDNLKTKLLKLDMERRSLITLHEHHVTKFQSSLLTLLQQHSRLAPQNGHPKARSKT